jgi:hypothetical protein
MNLCIRCAGFLGLVLLLAVSAAGCEDFGQASRVAEVIEHANIPESALQKIAADTHISRDNLPALVKAVSESTMERDVKRETSGLDVETANKDIADACKLAERLPGEPSVDPFQADTVKTVERTLENIKSTRDDNAVSTICAVADVLES